MRIGDLARGAIDTRHLRPGQRGVVSPGAEPGVGDRETCRRATRRIRRRTRPGGNRDARGARRRGLVHPGFQRGAQRVSRRRRVAPNRVCGFRDRTGARAIPPRDADDHRGALHGRGRGARRAVGAQPGDDTAHSCRRHRRHNRHAARKITRSDATRRRAFLRTHEPRVGGRTQRGRDVARRDRVGRRRRRGQAGEARACEAADGVDEWDDWIQKKKIQRHARRRGLDTRLHRGERGPQVRGLVPANRRPHRGNAAGRRVRPTTRRRGRSRRSRANSTRTDGRRKPKKPNTRKKTKTKGHRPARRRRRARARSVPFPRPDHARVGDRRARRAADDAEGRVRRGGSDGEGRGVALRGARLREVPRRPRVPPRRVHRRGDGSMGRNARRGKGLGTTWGSSRGSKRG